MSDQQLFVRFHSSLLRSSATNRILLQQEHIYSLITLLETVISSFLLRKKGIRFHRLFLVALFGELNDVGLKECYIVRLTKLMTLCKKNNVVSLLRRSLSF